MIPLLTSEEAFDAGIRLGSLVLLAGVITLVTAAVYRWYVREELPQGVGLLFGATGIAIVLNTTATLGQSIGGTTDLLDSQAAAFTVLAFVLGGFASEAGRHVGDRIGDRIAPAWSTGGLDREVVSYVRGGGRAVRVAIPDEIHDIDGFDPVRADVREELAGEVLTFPGRMTHQELHDAFVTRLQHEYGIGKVDAEFDESGTLTYLAIGRGEAGIGHSLPPGQVAIAVRADPAYSASPGDRVRVWRTEPEPTRIAVGELRGISGDVVTIAIEEDDHERLIEETGYRLATLPSSLQAGREFASILRRSNDSIAEVTVADGADAVGRTPPAFDVDVLSVDPNNGETLALPPRDRPLAAGDLVTAMGRPDALRRFAAAAQGTSTSLADH